MSRPVTRSQKTTPAPPVHSNFTLAPNVGPTTNPKNCILTHWSPPLHWRPTCWPTANPNKNSILTHWSPPLHWRPTCYTTTRKPKHWTSHLRRPPSTSPRFGSVHRRNWPPLYIDALFGEKQPDTTGFGHYVFIGAYARS